MQSELIQRIQNRTLQMDMSDCNWGEGVALWGFNHSLPYAPNSAYLPFLKEWVERGQYVDPLHRNRRGVQADESETPS